jgi:hypothetical protein
MPLVQIDHLEPAQAETTAMAMLREASAGALEAASLLATHDKAGFHQAMQALVSKLHTVSEYGKVAFLRPDVTPEWVVMAYIQHYPVGYWHPLFTVSHAAMGIDPRISDAQIMTALTQLTSQGYLKMSHRGGGRAQYQWQGRKYAN